MKVNICGITHGVVECEDNFNIEAHFGQIDYQKCEIRINEDLPVQARNETICHEMLHGILTHLGYTEYSEDEQFVTAMASAINQGFMIIDVDPAFKSIEVPPMPEGYAEKILGDSYMTLCGKEENDE